MTKTEINEILEKHQKWLVGEPDGERANLYGANLRSADLYGANLRRANLRSADLRSADLRSADLRSADLRSANLRRANLRSADLRSADLRSADLYSADLRSADLRSADLRRADLRSADLYGANLRSADLRSADLDEKTDIRLCITCPDTGSFIAWKSAGGYIVKLEIPADAERSSATTRKCRASKVNVLEIQNMDGSKADVTEVESDRGGVYKVGEMVYPDAWDDNRWNECSHGIHFFVTRMEAEDWM